MIKYFFLLALFLSSSVATAETDNWQTAKSTHFIVYYKNAPEAFIKELIDRSEGYYNKITEDLGFIRYDFWLWDKRARIYIYDDAKDYQLATGQPGWSAGLASIKEKIIRTFPYALGFFETVLPHEMGHIIFREFVGLNNYAIPLWLEEGLASYQEKSKYKLCDKVVKEAIAQNKFINLSQLSNLDPYLMNSQEEVGLFYSEAFSVIDFLIKEFGKESFVLFCQNLRDKKNMEKAIASTYSFSSLRELNDAWLKYLTP